MYTDTFRSYDVLDVNEFSHFRHQSQLALMKTKLKIMPNVKIGMRERDDEMVGCGDEVNKTFLTLYLEL